MPSSEKITCIQCDTTDGVTWHNLECGKICNECFDSLNNLKTENQDEQDFVKAPENETFNTGTRKSTRSTRYKSEKINTFSLQKHSIRGRSRRHIFKSKPLKAPSSVATIETSESIYYKGIYFQVGDVVSFTDVEGDIYYAQIRGLMRDQYCEKSAVITWLLPTQASPPPNDSFDPATYIIGPEEDVPRKLECMEFVMHAPSDYYKSKTPYPPAQTMQCVENAYEKGFIWTTLNPTENKAKS